MSNLIVFTGGGTGGHVYPGLAVIEELREIGEVDVRWIGSTRGIERRICRRVGVPYIGIPSGKLRRYLSFRNITDLFRIGAGVLRAFFLLAALRPAFLFSKGGYVSVPPVLAARVLGIPCFTHESDVIPGLATRINARFVDRVLLPYEESRSAIGSAYRDKCIVSGNPVRRAITAGDPQRGRTLVGAPAGLPMVLFLGGSLGSATINRVAAGVKSTLSDQCFIVHQRGDHPRDLNDDDRYYSREFFYAEMPDLLAAADLVVARAGAGTLWELAATGTPALLIPLGTAGSRGDQIENARVYAAAGAARVVPDAEATPEAIAKCIASLLDGKRELREMAVAASGFGARDVARRVAEMILSWLDQGVRVGLERHFGGRRGEGHGRSAAQRDYDPDPPDATRVGKGQTVSPKRLERG